MKSKTKIILAVAFISAVVGIVFKINGYKSVGDFFLGVATGFWLYIFYISIHQ